MKIKLTLMAAITLMLGASSCSQSEDYDNLSDTTASPFPKSNLRSITDAMNIAQKAVEDETENTRADDARRITGVKPIVESTTRTDADTLLYVVEFEDNRGFALVAADRSITPLLALTDEGTFDSKETLSNQGFQYMLAQTKNYVSASVRPPLQPLPNPEYTDTIFPRPKTAPIVTVKWHQDWPENMYCSNCPAGCGPVAAAQIMSALELPKTITYTFTNADLKSESINWTELKKHNLSNSTSNGSNAHLSSCTLGSAGHKTIGRILRELGQQAKATYSPSGTWVTFSTMVATLKKLTGKNVINEGSGCESLFSNIAGSDHKLAIVRGNPYNKPQSGHEWVADATWEIGMIIRHWGLGEATYPDNTPVWICEETGSIEKYIHYNWGYGGNCNGFFLCGIFNPNEAYKYDKVYGNFLEDISFETDFKYAIFSVK